MTAAEAKEQISRLSLKKAELEKQIAVEQSKLVAAEEKLKEASDKVLEIVGSVEPERVQEYLNKLELEIASDLEKLESM